MPYISPEQLNLGAVAIIFLFFLKEFFTYLKSRKNSPGNGFSKQILEELKTQNQNHLHTINQEMNTGFDRLAEIIHTDNTKIIELLARIEGRLSK